MTPDVSEKSFSFSYLQIAFETSCTWTSFTAVDDITLSRTVRQLIDDMFDRLIRIHGNLLVDHALGYLTVAKLGLTGSILILLLSVKLVFCVCAWKRLFFIAACHFTDSNFFIFYLQSWSHSWTTVMKIASIHAFPCHIRPFVCYHCICTSQSHWWLINNIKQGNNYLERGLSIRNVPPIHYCIV